MIESNLKEKYEKIERDNQELKNTNQDLLMRISRLELENQKLAASNLELKQNKEQM